MNHRLDDNKFCIKLDKMQIGQHFGKRKPRWNFFSAKQVSLKERHGTTLRLVLIGMALQALVLCPLLYWCLQNYNFFEVNIPRSYNLREHLEIEKTWIIFLYFFCISLTSVVNFILFSRAQRRQFISFSNVVELLPGEAADQRRAS